MSDILERLRTWHTEGGSMTARDAADHIEALTKERDDLEIECAVHAACTKHRYEELVASQAREAKLQSALMEISYGKFPKDAGEYADDAMCRFAREALALPTDDTALQQRLAQERIRCMQACCDTCSDAIRSLT